MTDFEKIKHTACKYIELMLESEPLNPIWNRENYIFRKKPKWNYMDSCMIRALLMYAEQDSRLIDYAVRFIDSYVDENGNIPTINASDFNLDNICGGMNLIRLYKITGRERYRLAYEKIYNEQILNQPRLQCGSFWHKAIYPHQMWLDGAYMALPFLASYGKIKGDRKIIDDAVNQMLNIRKFMYDSETGLYYHGYNESREMFWADKKTGLSSQFWLRSNGWLCAGLADLYEITQEQAIGNMLTGLLDALRNCLTSENMLLQLPARPELENNYPETSGTLLFAYSAIKSYRIGVYGKSMAESGINALSAVTDKYIDHSEDIPVLKNICLMGGLGGENRRDGSAEYYLSERIIENDAKGIAPYLMASAEMNKLKKA